MENNLIAKQLASSRKEIVYVEAPAGCGKTYTIAQAVSYTESGKQLILTHTNAGVASIRNKLRQLGVSNKLFYVDTIDGFAKRMAASFPTLSQYTEEMEWHDKRDAAIKILGEPFIFKILTKSFTGIYVDEYQDCSDRQHQIILNLCKFIPCRIFGDPLQGIFDFDKKDHAINWEQDITQKIEKLGVLNHPYRWMLAHGKQDLGHWLMSIREQLTEGKPIDLPISNGLVQWLETTPMNKIAKCKGKSGENGTVVAIESREGADHQITKRLRGTYHSIEPIECANLIIFAKSMDELHGYERVAAIVKFAKECLTGSSEVLSVIEPKIIKKSALITTSEVPGAIQIANLLHLVKESDGILEVKNALNGLEKIPSVHIARKELWIETKKAIDLFISDKTDNLLIAAKQTREQTRIIGRHPESRLVSRVLLIKGLEFDHAIVLDADKMTSKELYVAMTRGKRSLTILSKEQTITPKIKKKRPANKTSDEQQQLSFGI